MMTDELASKLAMSTGVVEAQIALCSSAGLVIELHAVADADGYRHLLVRWPLTASLQAQPQEKP